MVERLNLLVLKFHSLTAWNTNLLVICVALHSSQRH